MTLLRVASGPGGISLSYSSRSIFGLFISLSISYEWVSSFDLFFTRGIWRYMYYQGIFHHRVSFYAPSYSLATFCICTLWHKSAQHDGMAHRPHATTLHPIRNPFSVTLDMLAIFLEKEWRVNRATSKMYTIYNSARPFLTSSTFDRKYPKKCPTWRPTS